MLFKEKVEKKSKKGKFRENIQTIFSAILIALLIRIFIIEAYKIPTGSMIPTLIEGDHLLVNKFIYGVRIPILGWKLPAFVSPKRGDIMVFHYPGYVSPKNPVARLPIIGLKCEFLKWFPTWVAEFVDLASFGIFGITNTAGDPKNFIKRTIGIPGDVLSIKNDKVYINDQELIQSVKIKPKLRDRVLAIHNPIERGVPSKDNYIEIPKGEHFYSFAQEKVIGREVKGSRRLVFAEHIGNFEHAMQRYGNTHEDLQSSSKDIPFLYIPKKDDEVKLSVNEDINGFKTVDFVVNGMLLKTLTENEYKNINSKFYNHRFYNETPDLEIIPNIFLHSKRSLTHTIDADYYFMMGDNRDNSSDSREWGLVHEQYVIGSPLLIYWSYKRFTFSLE